MAALAFGVPAGATASSSGEITRALVSSDWTTASVAAFAVRSNECGEPPEGIAGKEPPPGEFPAPDEPTIISTPGAAPWRCGWIAFATLGPGASADDCASPERRWGSFGKAVQLIWKGPELKGPGLAQLDLQDATLGGGSASPLLCLAAVEAVFQQVQCKEGKFGSSCPPYRIVHSTYQLDSALLEVIPTLAATEQSQLLPVPGEEPCKKQRKRHKRAQKHGGLALGPNIRAKGRPRPMRRCKTG